MNDDPLQRGTPPGSLRHFAVTYAPVEARPLLAALYAFEAEIDDTVRTSNHEVAHTRLQWWRGEVDRLLGGQPQHPVTRALLPLRACAADDLTLLHEPLVAADIDLACLVLQNAQELEAYCFRAGGSIQTLAAVASRTGDRLSDRERAFARELGSCVRRTEMLRDLRAHLARGKLPIPLDALAAIGVDPAQVRPDSAAPPLLGLLESMRRSLASQLCQLPTALQASERAAQRQGLVLAALHGKLLDHIDHRTELARTRAEVPAWTKLWTAWRTAVRAA
ncbi:MAG TPA: squalene/phytoene synthase family protein [Steroidobacteraceae bacterium]|nr:squalene/phytoene synthase family protein [Steroidobacteraceae bacterium]